VDDTVRTIELLTDAALGRPHRTLSPFIQPTDIEHFDVELGAVRQHGTLDAMPDPSGSHRWLKRWVLRLGAFNWSRQRAVNHAVANSLELLMNELQMARATAQQLEFKQAASSLAVTEQIEAAGREMASKVADLQRAIREEGQRSDAADVRVTETNARLDDLGERFKRLSSELFDAVSQSELETREWLQNTSRSVDQQAVDVAALRADQLAADSRILATQRNTAALRSEVARLRIGDAASARQPSGGDEPIHHSVDEMYSRFEAAFRPSNAELQQRFEDYLDVLGELTDSVHPLIDVGAGRGEFVAMLADHRVSAIGIDLSADAVAEATRHGRRVELADAVDYLGGLADETVGAVTAFHVVEHLPPATLLQLLDESLRVLRPGGLLIFETPNPTNLVVGAAAFYHDPTHLRPVTPTFMEFLAQDRGFTDVNIRFLHALPEYDLELAAIEGKGGRATELLLNDLRWALKGPQDYAVIARRPAGS
jgi:2-polyprenyl-3-methyl-5-hydroxy-6-metoxy-1,4-benzoquinol methylase